MVARASPTLWGVQLTLSLRTLDPPEGDVEGEDGLTFAFEGWMGLLGVLFERVSAVSASPSHGADQLET